MRLRIADRILVAVAGLLLLACCAGIVAQMFFGADLVGLAQKAFTSDSINIRAALIALAVLLLVIGVYCVFVLFRHRKRKDKFILQKNESGELAISIKALENMVQKCLDQHNEIQVQKLYLENRKDGLLIRIRGSVAGGISIPLTVEALQKQIRQYVTACSGVEIKGIRVQIESSGEDAQDAPFAIAAPAAKPLLHEAAPEKMEAVTETAAEPAAFAEPVQEAYAAPNPAAKTETPAPVIPEEDEDDRPLHQRLFSTKPEPCIVPEPPAEAETTLEIEIPQENEAPSAEVIPEEAIQEAQPQAEEAETAYAESENPAAEADPEFVESLKAFDDLINGGKKEEEVS